MNTIAVLCALGRDAPYGLRTLRLNHRFTVAASYLPPRRAAAIDPVQTLRAE